MTVSVLICFFLVIFIFILFFVMSTVHSPQTRLETFVSRVERASMNDFLRFQGSIPKRFHQTWKTKILPEKYVALVAETKRLHPDYEHILWDDDAMNAFVRNVFPEFWKVFQSYDVHMKRVDAARYLWLHEYGGIYLDLDSVALRPMGPLLQDRSLLFGYAEKNKRKHNAIPNAFMAASPRHPFLRWIIQQLPKTKDLDIVHATGPNFLTHCLRTWGLDTTDCVVPMPILFTHSWHEDAPSEDLDTLRELFPQSYTTTFWAHTWFHKQANHDKMHTTTG